MRKQHPDKFLTSVDSRGKEVWRIITWVLSFCLTFASQ